MARQQLSAIFHEMCTNVYFQPPTDLDLKYPCIIYEERNGDTLYADNKPYRFTTCYTVTYIDTNPDAATVKQIAMLPMCRYDRRFTQDHLYHSVFIMYDD